MSGSQSCLVLVEHDLVAAGLGRVRERRGEIEAWLSLGATSRVAYQAVAQESMKESLIPNIDQTRATGLVTLPGAFVGALLGGASPAQAAMLQLASSDAWLHRSPFLVRAAP